MDVQKVINVAIGELGKEEKPHGSNWGPEVYKYLQSVGITFPASWCMAFVYWCFEKAGGPLPYRSGGVLNVWNHTDPEFKKSKPQPGDIFIQDHGKGLGHTGIVEKVEGLNIHTIEGNTNDTGSREGYEVCRRVRTIKSCIGFIRLV